MKEITEQREQHYTLGVAGHIDHGKTTLTKALTGQDTDRLIEEQQRQISIELGFASFPLSTEKKMSIIDVPGHERFIRQMVAGVAGIDLVLLVVSADEGFMPQTKEHLDILQILGVKHGIIVLTKIDTVDEEFIQLVEEQLKEDVQATFLANSPIIHVDSLSGLGIDRLKVRIEEITLQIPPRPIQGMARLPIDRVFSKKGFGTVITGTIYQGKIAIGDELHVLPLDRRVKVRNIQVHGEKVETAYAGQRTAINISDVRVDELQRGDSLISPGALSLTERIDIHFELLADLDFSIKQRAPIRLHLATSEVLGKIIFFDRNELKPGESCYAQLVLEEPISTVFGDRLVLRRPTPMTTIGGGSVVDPYAQRHRFGLKTVEMIAAKQEGDLPTRALRILELEGIKLLQDLLQQLGMSYADWQEAISGQEEEHGLLLIDGDSTQLRLITTRHDWESTWVKIQNELAEYHKRFPLQDGIDRKQIQAKYFPALTAAQWNLLLKQAQTEEKISLTQERVSLFQFVASLREKDEQIWQEIKNRMRKNLIEVPAWNELIPKQMPAHLQSEFLHFLLRHKQVIALEEGRYVSTQAFDQFVQELKAKTPPTFSIQDIREVVDTSRKYLIPFLETLDRLGYTVRQGNDRVWK